MTPKTNDNRPSHRLYHVVGEGKSAVWMPIGPCFAHRDGRGFNILIPFIGKVVMRDVTAKDDDQGQLV